MRLLFSAVSGALFGIGLMVSGMTDTTKVQGWLDLFGDWDPTLAFVLGGAVLPMTLAWIFIERRGSSLLGSPVPVPARSEVDASLLIGSAIFGAGWALVGLCPGPAMASLSYGGASGLIFFVAMIAGMALAVPIRARVPALRTA